jgi:Phycobilisome protein
MNSTLENNLRQADGRYFTDAELQPLENFLQTYQTRVMTYHLLKQQSEALIDLTLYKLQRLEPDTVTNHRDTCKRDMSYVIQALALSLLRDDEAAFREQLILWMQNIMVALRKEAQSARAYKLFQEVVTEKLPANSAALINHYLGLFVDALMTLP